MIDKNSESYKHLKKMSEEASSKCIRCGECRLICPVYDQKHAERYTSRGKVLMVAALVNGTLKFTPEVREALENCLLCTGCASLCSSGVRSDKLIIAARQVFAEEMGLPFYKKAITKSMRSKKIMDKGVKLASMAQNLLFKKVPQTSGLYRRFMMPKVDENQYIPEIAETPFRERVKSANVGSEKSVTFFTGCMANYFMPEVSEDLVKVLNKLDINVNVPNEQGCCGMPMMASGDRESVRIAAIQNIEALANLNTDEPIVLACASCGHMLKHGYTDLFSDDPFILRQLENISERTIDINQYLINVVGKEKLDEVLKASSSTKTKVTYHDPCHMRKAQGIVNEPREVLAMATNNALVEMNKPEACCGLGGTYTLAQMELSKSIQKKKVDDAISTEAECIVTSCPGCIIQLRDGVRRSSKPQTDVKHIVNVLADALK